MLLDTQNLFSDAQAITSASAYSTNTVRFGLGNVSFVPLLIQVVEDFSDAQSVTVKVQTSADESFSNPVDLAQTSLALSELKAGKRFPLNSIPEGNLGYIRLAYAAEGDKSETTGKITAGIAAGIDSEI